MAPCLGRQLHRLNRCKAGGEAGMAILYLQGGVPDAQMMSLALSGSSSSMLTGR